MYLESFIIRDVEQCGLVVLKNLTKGTREDNLMFLQRFYQTYASVNDPPTEKQSILIYLSKIESHLVDMVLQ